VDPERFAQVVDRLWLEWSICRPDLVPAARMLWNCLDDRDATLTRAMHAAGLAALKRGVWRFGADECRRYGADLLGTLLQAARSNRSKRDRGQFLTPECVAELLGRMIGVRPGTSVMEPAAGTGRMLLGAANAMREHGLDPTEVTWWANDIDPLAAALCAVNADLWGLGTRVVVGCGDGLLTTWVGEALARRQAAIDELADYYRMARGLKALRQLFELPSEPDPLMRHLAGLRPVPPKQPPAHSNTFDAADAVHQPRLF
jgi:hypothetical protein